jgi:hypothetical protein
VTKGKGLLIVLIAPTELWSGIGIGVSVLVYDGCVVFPVENA